MTATDRLVKVLALVEGRAPDKLSVEELSQEAGLSGSHLQRLFKLTTGQPLMDYVRGRKLVHSLDGLLNSDYRIIDLANEYGFQHEQSYIRAFYKEFGCTPGEARRSKRILRLRESIDPRRLHETDRGVLYGPEVVMVPSFSIVGQPHLFPAFDPVGEAYEPNGLANAFYYHVAEHIPNVAPVGVYIGFVHTLARGEQGERVVYMPSVPVRDLNHVPDGLEGRVIPTAQCVRFRYVGEHHYNDINMVVAHSTYREMDAFFADQPRYVRDRDWFFERIDANDYDRTYCRMEWMYPVRDTVGG